jgi:protein-disulfide isomerase
MSEQSKSFELSPSLAIIVAGVIIAAAILLTNFTQGAGPTTAGQQQAEQAAYPNADVSAPSESDHIVGSPQAPIVLVEYSDFQCPYCSRVHPTLKRIVSESNGQIAWVYRQQPLESLHPEARPAALASECIAEQLGNDGFWKFADTIFGDQSKMSPSYYEQLAVSFGVDKTKYQSCVASGKYNSKIDAQSQEANDNGGTGTPFTVVWGNGKQVAVVGAVPYATFMSVINQVRGRQ